MNFLTHILFRTTDLFIQIYAAAYAFGCVHTYIYIYISMYMFGIYQVCFVLKYLSLFARFPRASLKYSQDFSVVIYPSLCFSSSVDKSRRGVLVDGVQVQGLNLPGKHQLGHQHWKSSLLDLYDSIAIENNEFGCLRLQTCQFTLHLLEISYSHSYIIYINIQTYTSNYKVLMQCHANKFQTVSNLLVQVLCLDAVCLDSKPSKPLIKQHIAAYLQKYLRDFGCHSSILMPCKLALGRAKSWTKGTSVVSCQHYLSLYLLCLPHQCNRLP